MFSVSITFAADEAESGVTTTPQTGVTTPQPAEGSDQFTPYQNKGDKDTLGQKLIKKGIIKDDVKKGNERP